MSTHFIRRKICFNHRKHREKKPGSGRLPNRLSHQSFDFEQLREMLQGILSGQHGAAGDDETKALLDRHLAAQNGPLACERIVDVLIKIADDFSRSPGPTLQDRVEGRLKANLRRLRQSYRSYVPASPKSRKFQRHRYPVIPPEELGSRLSRIRQILGDDGKLHLDQVSHMLFKISG